jgi:putative nucleotidyltransferase with HDIG domain
MANSCLFFRQAPVISIQQAIEAVGFKSLYDIVMLNAMADGFAREIGNNEIGRKVWEHSIVVALIARELSTMLGMRGTEQAFLCGLLHDIGKILLVKGETERFSRTLDGLTEEAMLHAEEEAFGLTHAQIGAYVTHQWDLPQVVCTVIMYHHDPKSASISTAITYIVNAADRIANAHGYGLRDEDPEQLATAESVLALKLSPDQVATAWQNAEAQVAEVLAAFG